MLKTSKLKKVFYDSLVNDFKRIIRESNITCESWGDIYDKSDYKFMIVHKEDNRLVVDFDFLCVFFIQNYGYNEHDFTCHYVTDIPFEYLASKCLNLHNPQVSISWFKYNPF